MTNFIKTHRVLLLLLATYALYASAATLKTWSAGEAISSTDLNNNFSIVNSRSLAAKSAATAALAAASSGPTIPKAYGVVGKDGAICNAAGACTTYNTLHVSAVTRGATAGDYTVDLSGVAITGTPMVVIGAHSADSVCYVTAGGDSNTFLVQCRNTAAASVDAAFSFILMGP